MKASEEQIRLKKELHELIYQVDDVQTLHAVQYLLSRIQSQDAFLGSFAFLKDEPDLYGLNDLQNSMNTP